MTRIICLPYLHWTGSLPLVASILGPLMGLHLILVLAVRHLSAAGPVWAQAGLPALILVALWQVIGTLRSADQALRDREAAGWVPVAYAACIGVVCLTLVLLVDLWASAQPKATVKARTLPDGVHTSVDDLHLEGPITLRMFYATEDILTGAERPNRLTLDSPGGAVHAARGLARLVRENALPVHVTGTCYSACTLVLLAAPHRTMSPQASVGFHSYAAGTYSNLGQQVLEDARSAELKDRKTLLGQGLSEQFVTRIFDTPHSEIWRPTPQELLDEGVLTAAP